MNSDKQVQNQNWEICARLFNFVHEKQSLFFTRILLNNLPNWFFNELRENKFSVCDIGCAGGELLNHFSKMFDFSEMAGIDFCEEFLSKGKAKYNHIKFISCDITDLDLDEKFDIVFSSNTLEHFNEPIILIEKVLDITSKYFVLLVPFQEFKRHRDHLYTFDLGSFPIKIKNFHLVFSRIVDTSILHNSYWVGKQALIIYANENSADLTQFKLFEQKKDAFLPEIIARSIFIKPVNILKKSIFRLLHILIKNLYGKIISLKNKYA